MNPTPLQRALGQAPEKAVPRVERPEREFFLFKIGALVTVSVRRVKLAMASGCPYKLAFAAAHRALSIAANTS